MNSSNKYTIGIVLSGGAVRGFAHLGVLKALHEAEMEPEIISGVSAGSIVGAFYADGFDPSEILEIFEQKKFFELVNLDFKDFGLLDINGLEKLLTDNLRVKNFEDLKKPLYVAATNLLSGSAEYFSEGNIVEKVLASSSIPVLFKPQTIDETPYVDGGLVNNLPLKPIKDKCKKVIGVNVNPIEQNPELNGIRDIAVRSFHISIANSVHHKKDLFDVYFEPKDLKKFGYFNVKDSRELFKIGYNTAKEKLANL